MFSNATPSMHEVTYKKSVSKNLSFYHFVTKRKDFLKHSFKDSINTALSLCPAKLSTASPVPFTDLCKCSKPGKLVPIRKSEKTVFQKEIHQDPNDNHSLPGRRHKPVKPSASLLMITLGSKARRGKESSGSSFSSWF